MDWTLQRVNGPNEIIVLNRNLRSYHCGRGPANFLECPSLVVSRRHCVFVRTENGISVIDLSSSNGVYVDGQLTENRVLVELREGNVIGIGSPELYRDNEPMFVYKLHKGNVKPLNSFNGPDSPAARKPPTSRIRVRDCSVEVLKLPSNMTAKQKQELLLEDRMKRKIYEAEQKKRRTKNKWAQNVQLPMAKRRSLSLSKSKKLEIANERSKRLKQLAEKQKENTRNLMCREDG